MKLILATLVICAIVVYVYMDYDNIKARWFPDEKKTTEVLKVEEPPESAVPVKIKKEPEMNTKFKEGEMVFLNATVGDLMGWKQNTVPGWATYDGSPNEANQRVQANFEHGSEVKIVKVGIGREGKTWYYVRTSSGFPLAGWVEEKYVSKEEPPRRSTR